MELILLPCPAFYHHAMPEDGQLEFDDRILWYKNGYIRREDVRASASCANHRGLRPPINDWARAIDKVGRYSLNIAINAGSMLGCGVIPHRLAPLIRRWLSRHPLSCALYAGADQHLLPESDRALVPEFSSRAHPTAPKTRHLHNPRSCCQGRSETRPLGRRKTRPEECAGDGDWQGGWRLERRPIGPPHFEHL